MGTSNSNNSVIFWKIPIICFLLFLFSMIFMQESKSCDLDVDSLFSVRISSLEQKIKNDNTYVYIKSREDMLFFNVLLYLADESFYSFESHHYNPRFSRKEIELLKEWYNNKKDLITCEKVERAYYLLQNPPPFKNMDDVELYDQQLDSLLIEPRKR